MATTFRLINYKKQGCFFRGTTQLDDKCAPYSYGICSDCLYEAPQCARRSATSVDFPGNATEIPSQLAKNGRRSMPEFLLDEPMSSSEHDVNSCNSELFELMTYTQEYRNDLADAIRNMEHGIQASLSLQEERVKEEIHIFFEDLVKAIQAKKQELSREVDKIIKAEKKERQQEIADFALQAHHVIQVVEVNRAKLKDGRRDKLLTKQVHAQLQAVKKHRSYLEEKLNCVSEILFIPSDNDFNVPLGRVMCKKPLEQKYPRRRSMEDLYRRFSTQINLTRKPGLVFHVIVPPSPLSEKFRPWAVSVSETGNIAVVDRGNNCIHVFNSKGEFLRYIAQPHGSKSRELYGVAFVSRNTFALAEYSPSTRCGSLTEMSISGEHLRVIGNLRGPAHVTSFSSSSNVCQNVIAVYYTNSVHSPDVFVSRDESKVFQPLGKYGLNRPQKGVILEDKLFFSDSNDIGNQGCVKVFHSDGHFSHCFGDQPLWNEESLGHPLRIAADPINCCLLVYQQFGNRMRVFDVTGACISEFATISGLLDFTVTPLGKLIGTCGKNGEFPNSVVILSYI